MKNPFEEINERLDKISSALFDVKALAEATHEGDEIMDVDEVAKFLRMSDRSVYRLVKSLDLPHYKRSGKLWFSKNEVMAWMKE